MMHGQIQIEFTRTFIKTAALTESSSNSAYKRVLKL